MREIKKKKQTNKQKYEIRETKGRDCDQKLVHGNKNIEVKVEIKIT